MCFDVRESVIWVSTSGRSRKLPELASSLLHVERLGRGPVARSAGLEMPRSVTADRFTFC